MPYGPHGQGLSKFRLSTLKQRSSVGRTETKTILVRAQVLRTTVISPTGGNAGPQT